MPAIRHVVFDLDGTLLDTLQDIADTANTALAEAGFPVHPKEKYATFVGNGVRTLIERILPDSLAAGDEWVTRLMIRVKQLYATDRFRNTRPYPGIIPMLKKLTEKSVPMAILSNKPRESLVPQVKKFFSRFPFAFVAGACPGVPLKPDPRALTYNLEHCGWSPAEVMMVGDTGIDVKTARMAGATGVGVLWGFRDRGELEAAGARFVLNDPSEIFGLFD